MRLLLLSVYPDMSGLTGVTHTHTLCSESFNDVQIATVIKVPVARMPLCVADASREPSSKSRDIWSAESPLSLYRHTRPRPLTQSILVQLLLPPRLPHRPRLIHSIAERQPTRLHEPQLELAHGVRFLAGLSFGQTALRDRVDVGLEVRGGEDGDGVFGGLQVVEWDGERVERWWVGCGCCTGLGVADEHELQGVGEIKIMSTVLLIRIYADGESDSHDAKRSAHRLAPCS